MEPKWYIFEIVFGMMLVSVHCQSLRTVINVHQTDGVYNEQMSFSLNENVQHLIVFPKSKTENPYTIRAWSENASSRNPVIVVVRRKRHVVSWEVPFSIETMKSNQTISFQNTSRIFCYNPNYASVLRYFVVSLSTSSQSSVDIFLKVEEMTNFYVKDNEEHSIVVSPSETQYVHYGFLNSNKSEMVRVEIDSHADACLIVSVQESKCPVFDLESDVIHRGKFQTVSTKGAMTINNEDFPSGFFLVFVAKVDNYLCSGNMLSSDTDTNSLFNTSAEVSFKIMKLDNRFYLTAIWTTLAAIGLFCLIASLMIYAFSKCATIPTAQTIGDKNIFQLNFYYFVIVLVAILTALGDGRDPIYPPTEDHIEFLLTSPINFVNNLTLYPRRACRKSYSYLWHSLSIAIFYSIPVVQLVWIYQKRSTSSGNQDICYYNFRCSNPALGFNDFNHIFSNVGYILIGIFFLVVSYHDRATIQKHVGFGIPIHHGLYFAMGFALIIEGLLSACYHICPSQTNFQFDTSFMYVIAVLCMVKLYQNRHPDVSTANYTAFIMLGFTIFFAAIGILHSNLIFWIFFALFYSFLNMLVSFKIYFLSHVFKGLRKFWNCYKEHGFAAKTFTPIKRGRFIVLLIANILNSVMLITGLCLYDSGITDFGTFLLALLMANTILHTIFYTSMKLIHGERICIEAVCNFVLMIAFWVASATFFFQHSISWSLTPAQSRLRNQECLIAGFYDKHDIWHLLSAPALYFTFMYLKSLDNDIVNKRQEEIVVF